MEPLNDMALFVEVVKAGGFRRASDATGVPNSTISRRINDLEKAVGLRLLNRTTRRIELTEAGQIYYDHSRRIVEEARIAHEQLAGMVKQPGGLLRISFPAEFAINFLTPHLEEFAGRYPGISFDFDLSPRRVDLVGEPFDLAIRIGVLPDSSLIARLLTRMHGRLFASPRYLDLHGEPREPEDLAGHKCLRMLNARVWNLNNAKRSVAAGIGGRFTMNSIGMVVRMAVLDMGIAFVPEEIVAAELANGQLQRILPRWQGDPLPIYAITETRLIPAKTQRFLDFLQDKLARLGSDVSSEMSGA